VTAEYSADRPISSRNEDRFNRWPFAQRLADTIARRSDASSLVLGIFGKWGDGKTSTFNLMLEALRSHENVIPVQFNPWQFQSEEQLLRGFFATLAAALDQSLETRGEKVGGFLKRYGAVLSVASVVGLDPGAAAAKLGETLSTVDLSELRSRIETILGEAGKRVVVLIDDIDRLDRLEIQAIFKLVKLSASFPYTVYVLAFDDEVVADALGEKYGHGGREAGQQFLEKIIQVPLYLPAADRLTLRRLAFEGVEAALRLSDISLDEETASAFAQHFMGGLEVRLRTPRQATRYANALTFALPILKGEVNTVDQMLIEGIRLFYPRLYTTIRDNPSAFRLRGGERREPRDKETIIGIINHGLEGLDSSESEAARELLQVLFPRLKGVFGNWGYGSNWDATWAQQQRICSSYYFDRYFSYAVPLGDVSDQQLKRVIDIAETGEERGVEGLLATFRAPASAARFVEKLQLQSSVLPPRGAATLALAIARMGGIFPMDERVFRIVSTFSQAGLLVAKLVMRSGSQDERARLAHQVIRDADPLPFGAECFRWLREDEDLPEPQWVVPKATVKELGESLASRIRKRAWTQPPYDEFGDRAPHLLYIWRTYGPPGDLETYLQSRFGQRPAEAARLVGSYVTIVQEMESGLQRRGDFRRDQYDAIAAVVDPELVMTALESLYGKAVGEAEDWSQGMPPEEQLARQFAHIHREVSKSRLAADGGGAAGGGVEASGEPDTTADQANPPPERASRTRSRQKERGK
jgi:hypothetical protein